MKNILKENMRRFNTKNLNERGNSYFTQWAEEQDEDRNNNGYPDDTEKYQTLAAQFSFTIDMMGTFQTDDYNTEDDDVAYIQRLLDKAGADAYAKADPPEEILVRAFDAQGLAKAKAAVEGDGFEVQLKGL